MEADELAEKWLCCEENFSQEKYLELTEFYVKNVLFPRGLHGKIQQFLETNRALSTEQKQVGGILANVSRQPPQQPTTRHYIQTRKTINT